MKTLQKLPISVTMVIYNEEDVLERALKSVAPYVDEIIIVHDGPCTDNSLLIAKKYSKKVFVLPHEGIAEHHRVFTYEKASHDWILQLDADEYISPDFAHALPTLINNTIDIYDATWAIYFHGKRYPALHKRMLFRKSKVYFIGAAQEYVKPIDKSVVIESIEYILDNNPHEENLSWMSFQKKQIPWAKIQARDLTSDFATLPKWNCRLVDWEKTTRIRIDHPILLGIFATTLFHVGYSIRDLLRYHSLYYFYQGIYLGAYFMMLYYFVFRLQRGEKNIKCA